MTPEQLKTDAKVLFGDEWQSAMARALAPFHPKGRMSVRLLTQWTSGGLRVPDWVEAAVIKVAKEIAPELHRRAGKASAIALRDVPPPPLQPWEMKLTF